MVAMEKIVVGVLALQGAFAKHIEMLRSLGVETIEVRKPSDLHKCHGLIIPGGESTTILRQISYIKLEADLLEFAKTKPLFGTCAGLILMSKKIISDPMTSFGILDTEVERNAFGRQVESFTAEIELHLESKTSKKFRCVFIRAPRIRAYSSNVEVLAEYENEPILVKQGFHLGATFHPELTSDAAVHRYFLKQIEISQEL
jgi:5'-phosphate synthase pdxT subunit